MRIRSGGTGRAPKRELPCRSASTSSTLRPMAARMPARLVARVVFPVPPFSAMSATIMLSPVVVVCHGATRCYNISHSDTTRSLIEQYHIAKMFSIGVGVTADLSDGAAIRRPTCRSEIACKTITLTDAALAGAEAGGIELRRLRGPARRAWRRAAITAIAPETGVCPFMPEPAARRSQSPCLAARGISQGIGGVTTPQAL